eukprot:COSAG01_NODE_43493_length_429_cov_0.927273_1_plen_73_part_10
MRDYWLKQLKDEEEQAERQLNMLAQTVKQASMRLEQCTPLKDCLVDAQERLHDLRLVFEHYVNAPKKNQFNLD